MRTKLKNYGRIRCHRLSITAHQHQTIVGKDHETVYVQAGQNAEELVHLSKNANEAEKLWKN